MAIATETIWEVRSTGSSTNGGGFKDLNPGTSVDYSQQDAAQLALTDIASDGAGTGISSTTGGFTAAMEGNCIYISGSGFTTGWYQITGYTDTNNITIDRSCGASASGGTGNVGGAWNINVTNFNTFFNSTNKTSDNVVHIKKATWALSWTATATIAGVYLTVVGYNSTRGDAPDAADRPTIDFGTGPYAMIWSGAYGRCHYINVDFQCTGNSTPTLQASGSGVVLKGCKITRSGYATTAFRHLGSGGSIYQCEFVSTTGTACQVSAGSIVMAYSYFHDSVNGLTYSGSGSTGTMIHNCIFDTCSTYGAQAYSWAKMWECTVYNCGTGVRFTSFNSSIVNCILKDCTTGLNAPATCYEDFNTFHGNTTDRTGGVKAGVDSITSDPLLADAANQDFTLSATSPAFNSSLTLGSAVGLP